MNELEFAGEWMGGYDWRFGVIDPSTGKLAQQFTLHRYPEYYAGLIRAHTPGVYLTINPMRDLDHADMIIKMGWDFDGKDGYTKALKDAQLLRATLKERWGCETLLIFTGGRGFHVYVWLRVPYIHADAKRIVEVYRELYRMSTHGLTLETIDPGLDYPKHQIRAVFTAHQNGKGYCAPVEEVKDDDGKWEFKDYPIEAGFTEYYRSHGVPPEVVHRAEMNLDQPKPPTPPVRKSRFPVKARPCLEAIIHTGVMDDDGWMRTQGIFEMRRFGVKREELKEVFRTMPKYDVERTDYHLNYVYNRKEDLKVRCETIASKGYCMGARCRLYRWLEVHGKAPTLNPSHNFWDKMGGAQA